MERLITVTPPVGTHCETWLTDTLRLQIWIFPDGRMDLMGLTGQLEIPLSLWLARHRQLPCRRLDLGGASMTFTLYDARTSQEG